jgi:hypothetical protein
MVNGPGGGLIPLESLRPEIEFLRGRIEPLAGEEREIPFSPDATDLWRFEYKELSEGKSGLVGAVTGRA